MNTPAFRFPAPLKHSIPYDFTDPNGFVGPSYYPVLQEYTATDEVNVSILYYASVRIDQQDGIWVHGMSWQTGTSGCCFAPGRKWGEFPDALTATLYAWERIAHDLDTRHPPDTEQHTRQLVSLLTKVRAKVAHLLHQAGQLPPPSWAASAQLELFP